MYIEGTFKSINVHIMYMKRPKIPSDIHTAVDQQSRSYENSWWQTLERILEQQAGLDIKSTKKVEA